MNSWFSRDVTKILKSKPGGLQNFYLHLRKYYQKVYTFTREYKYKEKHLSKFSNVHNRKETSILVKVNSRCVFLFPCWAPTWRLHTKLYKFVWNVMSNNSSTDYRTDLRLGQSPYLFIVYSV